jgi:hypothetical protein
MKACQPGVNVDLSTTAVTSSENASAVTGARNRSGNSGCWFDDVSA